MPGDPSECRTHAETCKRLAENAATPEAKRHLLDLAAHWERLAAELEGAQAFLEAMGQIEPKPPSSGPSGPDHRKT